MIFLEALALIAAWIFFYKILKSRNKRLAKLKATIITLLFASLVLTLSRQLYTKLDQVFMPTPNETQRPAIEKAADNEKNQN